MSENPYRQDDPFLSDESFQEKIKRLEADIDVLRAEVKAWRECRLWTDDNGNWKWYDTATSKLIEETNKVLGIH